MPRKKRLEAVLEIKLESREDLASTFSIIDTFVDSCSLEVYAVYMYREDLKDTNNPFCLICRINATCEETKDTEVKVVDGLECKVEISAQTKQASYADSREAITGVMVDIDSLIDSLPKVLKLNTRFFEDENQE